MKSKREYTSDEKLQYVELVIKQKKKAPEVCKMFELDRQTLHRWIKEYNELGEKAFHDKSLVTAKALNKKQEREIQNLKDEIDILKKALAYFAKPNGKK